MMQKRMETLMQKLPAGTDAALIQSDVNRRYLTGMQSSAGTVLCFRDGAYLIIDFRYIEKARECVKNCTVLAFRRQGEFLWCPQFPAPYSGSWC